MPVEMKNKTAIERIINTARQRSEKFNAGHKLKTFNVGERVLLKSLNVGRSIDNTAAKFFRLYNGPFVLAEKVGKNTFMVANPTNNKVVGKFHVSALRKFYEKI